MYPTNGSLIPGLYFEIFPWSNAGVSRVSITVFHEQRWHSLICDQVGVGHQSKIHLDLDAAGQVIAPKGTSLNLTSGLYCSVLFQLVVSCIAYVCVTF